MFHFAFFPLFQDPWRPIQGVRPFGHLPVGPPCQQFLAEPTHLLDYPALRFVGFAQLIARVLDKIDQPKKSSTYPSQAVSSAWSSTRLGKIAAGPEPVNTAAGAIRGP